MNIKSLNYWFGIWAPLSEKNLFEVLQFSQLSRSIFYFNRRKEEKKIDEEKSSKESVASWTTRQNPWIAVYHENYLVFAKFSNQVAVQGCMIFVGNIAVMDFASLTRQVRIYKGIDAFLSMLIGLLRTFWMILNEPRIYLIRDEFREFTLLPLRSSPALSLLSHPFMSGCLFTTRSGELHEFKRNI